MRTFIKKSFWFISIIFICNFLIFSVKDENNIEWNKNKKIKFEDFQGIVDSNSIEAAVCDYKIKFKYYREDNLVKFEIVSIFSKNGSWMKVKSDDVLRHEQGHFDLAEIFARRIRRSILCAQFNFLKFESEADSINKLYIDSCEAVQYLYDLETNHSLDTASQIIWNNKIDSQLLKFKSYEGHEYFTIHLNQ